MTEKRLLARKDGKENNWDNEHYCALYLGLARQEGITVFDTSEGAKLGDMFAKIRIV